MHLVRRHVEVALILAAALAATLTAVVVGRAGGDVVAGGTSQTGPLETRIISKSAGNTLYLIQQGLGAGARIETLRSGVALFLSSGGSNAAGADTGRSVPDLVMGGGGPDPAGVISSDPKRPGSFLKLISNGNIDLQVDSNANGSGSFRVLDSKGIPILEVGPNGIHAGAALRVAGEGAAQRMQLTSAGAAAAGDVVVVQLDGTVTRATQASDTHVVGVITASPALVAEPALLAAGTPTAPVVSAGVATVRATTTGNGPIAPGDLLVTSSVPGAVMRAISPSAAPGGALPEGAIVGKALQGLTSGDGTIRIVVALR